MILQRKATWILIALIVAAYFAYAKYGDVIIEKNPQLTIVKEGAEKLKSLIS